MKKKLAFVLISAIFIVSVCSTSFAATLLSYGDSGDDVYMLQLALADNGYYYNELTGYYGDMTQAAVASFQYDYGLMADGVAGPSTLSYLGLYYDDSDSYYDPYYDSYYDSYYDDLLDYTLYPGMEGSQVYALQELLVAYGYLPEATGFYGDMTADAVYEFQLDYGLAADGVAGYDTISTLLGYGSGSETSYYNPYAEYADAIVAAASWTPAAASGYCASWVTQVLKNAGVLTYNLSYNANDYWANVCYSSDPADLAPGMIVASRYSYTYLGSMYGHVGIYIGDGLVISSIGYLETINIDEWIRKYNNSAAGSTVRWGYMPL